MRLWQERREMTQAVRMFQYLSVTTAVAVIFLSLVPSVGAQSYALYIPNEGTIRGVETPHLIGRASIPGAYIGTTCSVTATATNDSSTHAENNLRIATGTSSFMLSDVERAAGTQTTSRQAMQLGETITVHITSLDKLGYSADVAVQIDCPDTPAPLPVEPTPETETPDKRTPEEPSAEVPSSEVSFPGATEDLPRTGPGSLAGLFFATSIGGSLLYRRLHN